MLHTSGALTDAEFEAEKRRILGGGSGRLTGQATTPRQHHPPGPAVVVALARRGVTLAASPSRL
jgi:hypothetical protein